MSDEKDEMVVTPFEVRGTLDYDRLIKEFGTQRIDEKLKERIYKIAGEKHFLLERNLFFSHRDLDWTLREYEKGNRFTIYTGRGPSGHTHIGHLVPWMFTKWFQDRFKTRLYFQMTNDEKYFFNPHLSLDDVRKYTYENTSVFPGYLPNSHPTDPVLAMPARHIPPKAMPKTRPRMRVGNRCDAQSIHTVITAKTDHM